MKNLKLTLLAIIAVASSAQGTELYLDKINNQTVHKIQWEKLPLPGMLGKMRPVMIERFGSVQPSMPLIPPTVLSFKNPSKPSQKVFVEIKLAHRILKRRPRPGEDKNKYAFTELSIVLKKSTGEELQRLNERIASNRRYIISVNLKGLNLQKSTIEMMSVEIPTPLGKPRITMSVDIPTKVGKPMQAN